MTFRLPAGVAHASTEREMPWEGVLEIGPCQKCLPYAT